MSEHFLILIPIDQILDSYELTLQSFNENNLRVASLSMRCTSIAEAMYDIRETLDWNSSSLIVNTKRSSSESAGDEFHPEIGPPPVDLLHSTLHTLCLMILMVPLTLLSIYPSF